MLFSFSFNKVNSELQYWTQLFLVIIFQKRFVCAKLFFLKQNLQYRKLKDVKSFCDLQYFFANFFPNQTQWLFYFTSIFNVNLQATSIFIGLTVKQFFLKICNRSKSFSKISKLSSDFQIVVKNGVFCIFLFN